MDVQVVSVVVFSGREAPPAKHWPVRVGVPVTVQLEGLGPPRALVFGPDGARVPTRDAPLVRDGRVVGTEQSFTPSAAGAYRAEDAEGAGTVVARIDAS